ncbi:squalene/phytoene synthase family protein [Dokdonella immobilis]|uniref:Farnesyl-diphosphate farnesyltransferase n=1 Tax=Dokdonella immobilis TaxID=578942 RepID=A0A1I4WPH5_9GAMM|nr:squalene/phytoene synthase family protein [Dokdonella immobilis]SFN15132.1 farnesyl-diphosphate farnesyltransferase [Dokdonella immobilis]
MTVEALSSFEAKWALAHPELPLALRFASASQRPLISALACLGHEIAHAALRIDEPEVASTKLHWWSEELAALPAGGSRHPLTGVLAGHAPTRSLGAGTWSALVEAAMALREAGPASTLEELLARYRAFDLPLARAEAAILERIDIDATAQAMSLSRALHETIRLREALAGSGLPLPLDLLARHGLSRAELGRTHAERDAALREHFGVLASALDASDHRRLSALTAITVHVGGRRARRAARARDPLSMVARDLDRLPLSSAWAGWRAARRLQAGA